MQVNDFVTYASLSLLFSILIAVAKILPRDPQYDKKHKRGTFITVIMFISNIVYTAAFGWNEVAQSATEWTLDIINAIGIMIGLRLMFAGVMLKGKTKENNRDRTTEEND